MIPGANVLLAGPSGSGKTHAVRTLIEAGVTPFVVFTEPGMEVLADTGLDEDGKCKLHWHYIPPANQSFDSMIKMAKKINMLSNEQLQKLPGLENSKFTQFITLLEVLGNFKCQRCGEEFGDVSTWGPDRAVVLDSLSGLNVMAMSLAVGGKPIKTMPDWGVAMDNEERILQKLCTDTNAWFVLTAHLEPQFDEVMGRRTLMVNALGKKLAPTIPRFFSDVVLTVKEGNSFTWSTVAKDVDLKARNIPYKENMPPSFGPLVEAWKKKGGVIAPMEAAS